MAQAIVGLEEAERDKGITRSRMTLARVGDGWARDGARGVRYIRGLATWLNSFTNVNSRRANSFSVLEFFEWYEATPARAGGRARGVIPLPHEVTRDEANQYANWLRTRTYGLEEDRLKRDPTRKVESVIYGIVKNKQGSHYTEIRQRVLADYSIPHEVVPERGEILAIEKDDPRAFDRLLACMVEQKLLTRKPSIEELRRMPPDDQYNWPRVGLDFYAPPDVFAYYLDAHTDAVGEERSSTVLRRVAALSSLWRHYIERGENTNPNEEPLLKYNVWSDLVEYEGKIAPTQQKVYRAKNTPSVHQWTSLIETTLNDSIEDVRDRVILMLMFWMGLRVTEITKLTRKDKTNINGVAFLRLHRKKSKGQLLAVETEVSRAIVTLEDKMNVLAVEAEKRADALARKYERETGRPAATAPVPRWRRLLDNPNAPLVPSVVRWGCNRTMNPDEQDAPLSRQAVAMMLRRRASTAGIPQANWGQVHPHGFRHLGAKTAADAGTPLTTIQAALGHESLTTTGRYVEERDPGRIRLFAGAMPPMGVPVVPTEVRDVVRGATEVPEAREAGVRPQVQVGLPRQQEVSPPVVAATRVVPTPEATERPPVQVPPRRVIETTGIPVPEPEREIIKLAYLPPLPPPVPLAPFESLPPTLSQAPTPAPEPPKPEKPAKAAKKPEEPPGPACPPTLIGLGTCAPLAVEGQGEPDYAYQTDCWGDGAKDSCGRIMRDRIHGSQATGDQHYPGDPLAEAWVGRASRLPWWEGPGGKLQREMPILSALQIRGGGNSLSKPPEAPYYFYGYPDNNSPYPRGRTIRELLTDLWEHWVSIDGLDRYGMPAGPTAAAALVQWIAQAIIVGNKLNDDIIKPTQPPEVRWIPYVDDAELVDSPEEFFKTFLAYRQHREDMILKWFCDNARTFRMSRGDEAKGSPAKVDDRPIVPGPLKPGDTTKIVLPAWYSSPDPIADLPDDERTEALDFIRALMGSAAVDPEPRFAHGASRASLSLLIDQFCFYDDMIARQERDKPMGDYTPALVRSNAAKVLERINQALAKAGWDVNAQPFDAMVRARRTSTGKAREEFDHRLKLEGRAMTDEEQAAVEKRSVQSRQSFYIDLLAAVYGDEVKADKNIQTLARCKEDAPLSGYADLFRIDPEARTIAHTRAFQLEFAKAMGTHSECVARRIARQLWELRKLMMADPKAEGARILRRTGDELTEQVAIWASFRVPCPPALEVELRGRLGTGATGNVRFRRETPDPVPIAAGAKLSVRDMIYEVTSSGTYVADTRAHLAKIESRTRETRAEWERERAAWMREHTDQALADYPKKYLPPAAPSLSDAIPVRALTHGARTNLPAGYGELRWTDPPAGLDADNVLVASGGITGGKDASEQEQVSRAWETHGAVLLGRFVDMGEAEPEEAGYAIDEAQREQLSRETSVLSGKYKINVSTRKLLPNPVDLLFLATT